MSATCSIRIPPPTVRSACIAVGLMLLASCGVLPKREPMQVFELRPVASPAGSAAWPQANWSLLVTKPTAGHQLESDSIAVRPAPGVLQVYKSASWTDSVPDLLQTTLLHTFEDSGKILSVSRPGGGIRGQYQLLTEVRAFESEYQDGQPHAVTEVYAKLIQTSSGKVVAARSFRESEPAAGTEVGTVVDAFSRSLGRLSSAIAGWTLTEGSRQAPEPAATKQR